MITNEPTQEMLAAIGIRGVEQLFDAIPPHLRHPTLGLAAPTSEMETRNRLRDLASLNLSTDSLALFRGGGAYHHYIPAAVDYLSSRGEFLTPYTPYQPEISQGTLQTIFEFQTLVSRLYGMDIANASLYDGAIATVEAAIMSLAITKRRKVVCSGLDPASLDVLRTYLGPTGVYVESTTLADLIETGGAADLDAITRMVDDETAAVVIQSPNYLGGIEKAREIGEIAHSNGALFVMSANPVSLACLESPGSLGADIAIGEGQPLGLPLSFGGPYLGLLATRTKYTRNVPGRLVGKTVDTRGQDGYVLTLQTREQHIRREKASSNVCTNEAWCALRATIYLSLQGSEGLRRVARACVSNAHALADAIGSIPGFEILNRAPFFHEFAVRCPVKSETVDDALLAEGIVGGLSLDGAVPGLERTMLFCATEMNTPPQIERLVSVLRRVSRSS